MAYLRDEFLAYLRNIEKNNAPAVYANGLNNVERLMSVDIDGEFEANECSALYDKLQQLRHNPEQVGKKEYDIRRYASHLKKYVAFRKWKDETPAVHENEQTETEYYIQWFQSMAEKPEFKNNVADAASVREKFCEQFGVQVLKALSGIELLHKLFYSDIENSTNMCYMLEMDKQMKQYFGSISGGSAYKFGLFFSRKTHQWTTGSPMNSVELSEEEAIEKGTEIRDWLVFAAETISSYGVFETREDYRRVYDQIKHIPIIDNVWVLKYIQMIFPAYFGTTYAKNSQFEIFKFIKESPDEASFINLGILSLAIRKYGISNDLFGMIFYKQLYPQIALAKVDTTKGSGLADDNVSGVRYWIYSPGDNANHWEEFYQRGIIGIGWYQIGELTQYSSKEEMKKAMQEMIDPDRSFKNAAHATWQFVHEMKAGDIVFAKKGMSTLVGRGVVLSDYMYDNDTESEYPNYRKIDWTNKGLWSHPGQAAMKVLTDITPYTSYVAQLNAIFDNDENGDDIAGVQEVFPEYTQDDFLKEVFMDEESYDTLVDLIRVKKNVILQGAPGVGKTYAAKRLAYSMMGEKNIERVMMVQFHQSYTYEDFIEGFRPSNTGNGFEIKKGSFYNFCKKASVDLDNEYFFIIDEINRGNLSKIFGELFMLIENDKRGNDLQLLYSDERFFVPKNVYIIGMMNTADRSLAMLDYALRRRFAFFDMKPGFNTDGFREYRMTLDNNRFNSLIDTVDKLNKLISSDDTLGEGFCIGHSYFCNITTITDRTLANIVEYEIIPLLKEYWFDEPLKVKDWSDKLRSSIK